MKFYQPMLICALALPGFPGPASAQLELDPDQVIAAAQDWAQDNLDEDVLRALPEVDRDRVEKFLRQFQDELKRGDVLDLAALKQAANVVLPLLDAQAETRPYAAWLRTRLDYFEVAESFRIQLPATNSAPDQPPKLPPNPSPVAERQAWRLKFSQTDWPKGASNLVSKLKPIFAAENVPEQLVWVAEVESGFNPEARSPVGAAGLFQLMPETAKSLGLRRWPFDQRYEPEPSAQAAARYLKHLYDRFGNWQLALAAYNAGEGKVHGLLERSQTRSFDGIATELPAETQMFVPKVEATIQRREGVSLAELKSPPPG